MKKIIGIIISLLILITVVYVVVIYPNFVLRTNIDKDDIGEVLGSDNYKFIYFNQWDIKSIKKYDDKFTSSQVEIYFDNGNNLSITTSSYGDLSSVSGPYKLKLNGITIRKHIKQNTITYIFKSDKLSYLIKFDSKFEDEVKSEIGKYFK